MNWAKVQAKEREQLLAILAKTEVQYLANLEALEPALTKRQIALEMKSFRAMNQKRTDFVLEYLGFDQEWTQLAAPPFSRPNSDDRKSTA